MEKRSLCPTAPCVILLMSLFGHVTYGFILLTHAGSKFENKNNFTILDIHDDANFDMITSFPSPENVDHPTQSHVKLDEIVTLTHDTQTPTYSYNSQLYENPPKHSVKINGIDRNNLQDISTSSDSWDESLSKSRNQNQEQGDPDNWEYDKQNTSQLFPAVFERQEIIKMPEPIFPRGHSSLRSLQDTKSRVKRRARASVIVRVPPSSRYLRSGIQTYVSSPRQSPIDAQVGVLVVADHSVYSQYLKASANNHRLAVARIQRYFGMVFAMMNERFGTIKDPHLSIKVTISGILIAEKRTDSPWTEDIVNWSTKAYHGRASVDTGKSLRGFSQWLDGRQGLPDFDHAMVFTAYRLTDPYGVGLGGMAYLEAVCDSKSGNAVSIVGDKGDFQSVRVATHELAHSLGATHDGEKGAEACPSSDAYIMSSMTTHNHHAPLQNAFYFSKCSIRDMIKHLGKSRSSCVLNKPPVYYTYDLDRLPPGHTYSPDTQCQLIFGPKSKFCGDGNLASVMCGQLWCRDPNRDNGCRTNSYLTALPGTKCGQNGRCSVGECKPETTKHSKDNSNNNQNADSSIRKLRPTARIGGMNGHSRTNSNDERGNTNIRGVTGDRDRTITGGTPASRIGTMHKDRAQNVDSLRESVDRGRTADRARGRIIGRESISNTDTRNNRESIERRGRTTDGDRKITGSSSIYRDSRYNSINTIRNKYNTVKPSSTINTGGIMSRDKTYVRDNSNSRGSTIRRDGVVNRDRLYNRGSTISRDDSRNSAYNRGSTISRDDSRRSDDTYNRGSTISRDDSRNSAYNKGSTISRDDSRRSDDAYNRGSTISRDDSRWRDNTYNRGNTMSRDDGRSRDRTYNRGSTISRDNSRSRDSTYNRGSTITKGGEPHIGNAVTRGSTSNIDNTQQRDRFGQRSTINRNRPVITDNSIGIKVRGDSRVNRNHRVYPDTRITKDSDRHIDSRINRENSLSSDARINSHSRRNSDISRGSTFNRGSKNNNDLTKSSIRNVSKRNRTNSIPKTHRYSRPSHRLRRPRGRRHRSRSRGRSGSRRSGRKNKRKNRGKKRKNRCREDKNVNYCRGLINLNPEGCRRKAIRQYCCSTCRILRRSKKKMLQPR